MALTSTHVVLSFVTLWVVRWVVIRMRTPKMPPGPPGLPLLGNLLDIPQGPIWKTYLRWGMEYSECTYASLFKWLVTDYWYRFGYSLCEGVRHEPHNCKLVRSRGRPARQAIVDIF